MILLLIFPETLNNYNLLVEFAVMGVGGAQAFNQYNSEIFNDLLHKVRKWASTGAVIRSSCHTSFQVLMFALFVVLLAQRTVAHVQQKVYRHLLPYDA